MNPVEIKEFKKTLSKVIIKKSEKLVVRELDEVKPNHYESYVDEDKETFDVSLTIKEGIVQKSKCDCEDGNKSFCTHKIAVLLSITGKKKVGTNTVKSKANPTQLLLQNADEDKLKNWVWDLLQNNKDLALAFTHYFTEKPISYTTEEVLKSTQLAFKAVVKNKKNIEQSELKKLIQLWQNVHEPIVQSYLNDISNESNFEHLITITEACKQYYFTLNINTVKIHSYAVSLLVKVLEPLNNYANEDGWKKVVQLFLKAIADNNSELRDYFFIFIIKLIEISKGDRKTFLIDEFIKTFEKCKLKHLYDGDHPSKKLLEVVEAAGLFKQYAAVFKPITFDNAYNIKLIKFLIDNEDYKLAESYCHQQISYNYRDEYNLPYLNFLKQIYLVTQQQLSLRNVCTKILPLTFDFEDYLLVIKSFDNELLQKDFRTKIYTKARSNARNGYIAADYFCFKILDLENKPLKMIEIINDYTPYSRIVEYFETMFAANKDLLIKAITNKSEPWNLRGTKIEEGEEIFKQLYELIKNNYGEVSTTMAFNNIKSKNYYSTNKFIEYVEKNKLA